MLTAVTVVVIASLTTQGYDPITRTVSRLPAPGVDVAIGFMAVAAFAIAAAGGRSVALFVAAFGFALAALIHLDPASPAATTGHRVAAGIAVLGLTAAPFARNYGRISLALGVAEVAMLAAAAVLLLTPFNAWGAWERILLSLALAWMVLVALKILSREDTASARSAASRSGASYTPVSSVNSANR